MLRRASYWGPNAPATADAPRDAVSCRARVRYPLAVPAILRLLAALLLHASVTVRAEASCDVPPSRVKDLLALGETLFSDKALSRDGTASCATCHRPERGFTDGRSTAVGAGGLSGTRNTPTLLDAAAASALFWDGRRVDLVSLMLDPLLNSREHGLRDEAELEAILAERETYRGAFARVFPSAEGIDASCAALALARFVETLRSRQSEFERYAYGGEQDALTPEQVAGLELFRGRAGCTACHTIGTASATLTNQSFHNHGVGAERLMELGPAISRADGVAKAQLGELIQSDANVAALGRYLVTGQPSDIGAFRTPSLKNVELTGPYMHDGSVATLDEAVRRELYYSAKDRGDGFSDEERASLVAFLRALTSEP